MTLCNQNNYLFDHETKEFLYYLYSIICMQLLYIEFDKIVANLQADNYFSYEWFIHKHMT